MRITRKEMTSLQRSFLKPVVPMNPAFITPLYEESARQLKTINQKEESPKTTQENRGSWDRAWLQQLDLLTIFFASKTHPKPVTVLDPESEQLYSDFVFQQEQEIERKKEEDRIRQEAIKEEWRRNLPRDPRKRKASVECQLPTKKRSVDAGFESSSSATSSEEITPFAAAPENNFQSLEYRRFKDAYNLHKPSYDVKTAATDDELSDDEIATNETEIVKPGFTLDEMLSSSDDESEVEMEDSAGDVVNIEDLDESDTVREGELLDEDLRLPPRYSDNDGMLDSSDDEEDEVESIKEEKIKEESNLPIVDNNEDDDDIQFVSEVIYID